MLFWIMRSDIIPSFNQIKLLIIHMAPDCILQVRNVLIYQAVVGKNIISLIWQAWTMAMYHLLQVSNVLLYPTMIGKNNIHAIR